MPLVSILPELRAAQAGRYAVPLFDAFEMLSGQGIVQALREQGSPGMIGVYGPQIDEPAGSALVAMLRELAERAPVPVSLMLDHGASVEQCLRALEMGFTDVMFDGSALPLEQNIANTRQVAKAAHSAGACVEAELGVVGQGAQYEQFGGQGKGFTDPDVAERFVTESGCDVLAVAIGTAHGHYKGTPRLDLERLRRIRAKVSVPLALHGGSGLADAQFRAAIAEGIAKVNIFTDLATAALAGMTEAIGAPGRRTSAF